MSRLDVGVDHGTDFGTDPLGPEIRALFAQLRHGGDLPASAAASGADTGPEAEDERTLSGEAGRTSLGAQVRFQLRVRGRQLRQIRYRACGCPYTLATCEWLARTLTGRTLAACTPTALTQAVGGAVAWAERLGVPPDRLGRLLVIEDALAAALADGERQRSGPGAQVR